MFTIDEKILLLNKRLEEEPHTFQYWVTPKINGWFLVKDKHSQKVIKKCKTKIKADAIVVTHELNKIRTGEF